MWNISIIFLQKANSSFYMTDTSRLQMIRDEMSQMWGLFAYSAGTSCDHYTAEAILLNQW